MFQITIAGVEGEPCTHSCADSDASTIHSYIPECYNEVQRQTDRQTDRQTEVLQTSKKTIYLFADFHVCPCCSLN